MKAILDTIFQNIDKIALKYNIPYSFYKKYKIKYHEYEATLTQPKTNGHYIFCPWADPETTDGPDTCPCSLIPFAPEELINGLAKAVGPTLIISIIFEMNLLEKADRTFDVTDSLSKLVL